MTDVLQKPAENYKPHGHLDPTRYKEYITFHTYEPRGQLISFVEHFWTIQWDRLDEPYVSEQVMHRPYVDVYISENDSGIQYTFRNKRDYKASDAGRIIGVRFLPGAFHAFWHWSMAGLRDTNIAIERVLPEADSKFIKKILTLDDNKAIQALAALLLTKNPQPDPNIVLVNQIIAAIETENLQTVKDVAKNIGKSERWLQQLFQEYVGIGIKWLLQRNKLLEAAKTIRETDNHDWTVMAYDLDYSSQQHFITDFKRVLGKTPLQYKKEVK